MEKFLEEVDTMLNEYSKASPFEAGNYLLDICSNYENIIIDETDISKEGIYYYYKGYAYSLILDYDKAIKALTYVIKTNSEMDEAYLLRSKCLSAIGKKSESEEDLYIAYDINPDNWETNYLIAWGLLNENNCVEAMTYAEKAYEGNREDPHVLSLIAAVSHNLGEYDRSIYYLDLAIELDGDMALNHANKGISLRALDRIDEAIAEFKKAVEIYPESREYAMDLIAIYIDYKMYTEACDLMKTLLIMNPEFEEAYIEQSYIYFKLNRIDKAIEAVSKAIDINNSDATYFHRRANLCEYNGDYETALSDYEKIVELEEGDSFVYERISSIYFWKSDFENAVFYAKKALELDSENYVALTTLGDINYINSRYKKAINHYSKSIKIRKRAYTLCERGKCYYCLQDTENAVNDFLRTLEIDENNEQALLYLGLIRESENNNKEAIEYFQKYLKIEPNDYTICYELGSLYIGEERIEEALKCILNSLGSKESLDLKYNDIGICYHRLSRREEAMEYYEKAISENPEYALAYNNLGLLNNELGDFDKSIEYHKKALELNPEELTPLVNIGDSYFDKEDYEMSYKYFDEYTDRVDDSDIYSHAMICKFKLGDYEEARDGLVACLNSVEDKLNTLYYIAHCENHLGNFKKVIYYVNEYFRVRNEVETLAYYEYLLLHLAAVCHKELKEYSKEIILLEKIIKYYPSEYEVLYDLAEAYNRMDDSENTIKYLKELTTVNSEYYPAYSNIGWHYYKIENYKEAIKWCIKSIEICSEFGGSYDNLSLSYYKTNKYELAIKAGKNAIKYSEDLGDPYITIGLSLIEIGNKEEAIGYFRVGLTKKLTAYSKEYVLKLIKE